MSEPSSAQNSFKGRHFDKVFDFELFFKRDILTLFQPACVVVFSRWNAFKTSSVVIRAEGYATHDEGPEWSGP